MNKRLRSRIGHDIHNTKVPSVEHYPYTPSNPYIVAALLHIFKLYIKGLKKHISEIMRKDNYSLRQVICSY